MLRLVAVIVVASLVAGCTTWDLGTQWTKQGTMPQQVTYDDMECARLDEDTRRTPETVLGGVLDVAVLTLAEIVRISRYNNCMTSKGYVKA